MSEDATIPLPRPPRPRGVILALATLGLFLVWSNSFIVMSYLLGTELAARRLDWVGLTDRVEHKPGELSGGERQRAALARAIVLRPQVLLADEPTGNLDERTGEEIHQLLRRLSEDWGLTLIVVTHNLSLARRMDRQIRLIEGRALEEKPGQSQAGHERSAS